MGDAKGRGLSRFIIPEPEAIAVADVLNAVGELRQASTTAVRLRRIADGTKGAALFEHHRARRAEDYVAELTDRIASRARLAGMEVNELMHFAEAVLDQRMALPEGVEAMEAA